MTLLEILALQSEIIELKADPSASRARGAVLESEMHKGDAARRYCPRSEWNTQARRALVFDQPVGSRKTMRDELGMTADPSADRRPRSAITGLSGLPEAGHDFIVVKSEQ